MSDYRYCLNFPNSQIDIIWEYIEATIPYHPFIDKLHLRKFIYETMMKCEKICICCKKRNASRYQACPYCGIYWYCSNECQMKDFEIHWKECGNVDLPLEAIRRNAKIVYLNRMTGIYYIF